MRPMRQSMLARRWEANSAWRIFGAPSMPMNRLSTFTLRTGGIVLVLAAYLALEWVSFIHEYKGLPVTPWNPGLGVVFALMVFVGPLGGLVLFIGVTAAEAFVLDSDLRWPTILGLAALTASSYAAIAAIARQVLGLDTELTRLRDVLLLLAIGLVGAVLNSLLLSGLLALTQTMAWRDVWNATLPLMIGDAIGIAVVTPLLLRFVIHHHRITPRQAALLVPEVAVLVGLIGTALVAILGLDPTGGHKLFYLLFLPVVAAAVRHGLDGACLSLAVTQLGLVGLLHLRGYTAQVFTEFQMQMLVLTATGLIVGVTVTERRNADRLAKETAARLKEKEAEAAQAARLNLVSGMASALAHEITQPMTAARALARSAQHILRMPDSDLGRADQNLTTMIAQIDHAGDVLHHVRDFLRRGSPHLSTIEVPAVIDEALMLVRAEAASRQISLTLDIDPDLPTLHGDHVQLQQVLLNLVRNAMEAIAAAGGAGTIRVTGRRHDDPPGIEIGVADDGPGVPADMRERLFTPLATSKHEGLGLGLSICASIVAAHGGRIWLQSATPGGTEFRFFLPIDPPRAT